MSENREISPAARSVKKEFMCLSNLIRREMDASRVKRGLPVTAMHGLIIGYLCKNSDRDVFQKDIEEAFSYRRSTASTVLGLMEEKGLIDRVSVPYDARLKKLVLTDKALEIVAAHEEDSAEVDALMMRGISDEELDGFFSVLDRMIDNLKEEHGKDSV